MVIVIASKNKNKVKEIRNKFSGLDNLTFKALDEYDKSPDIVESGTTFSENALIKAREICKMTGEITMADDSGLVVDALNGEPGVYSARYGGEGLDDNGRTDLLLRNLEGIDPEKRTCRFVCSIAIVIPDGCEYTTEGTCEGIISTEKTGSRGFGYDPVFIVPSFNKTMAELTMEEKNRISHRAVALDKTEAILEKIKNDIKK